MKRILSASAIAMVVASGWTAPAHAQSESASAVREELAAMRAEMARMAARIDTLESELAEAEASTDAAADAAGGPATAARAEDKGPKVGWKGAPEIKDEGGWSFKPRGRLQYDAGITGVPDSTGRSDGFGNEARRARLGVSGDIPGGFGYKFEIDFAGSDVTVTDAFLSYETGNAELIFGQFNTFQSLEELTSSLHTSFIERAAFTDAFGFERRVGAGVQFEGDEILVQGGVFTDNMDDLSNQNWGADARVVAMPKLGDTQFHLGASAHFADLEPGSTVRYRQRPLVHFTGERFINTGNLGAESEFGVGLEGAIIADGFHAVAEGFWQSVNRPGGLSDPTFFGGYVEAGYFLTGDDKRGYKGGKFDRVKPANPVGEGGIGSIQVNLRYDYLDLTDAGIVGGQQNGYFVSMVWKPTDYVLFLANYGRLEYDNAVFPTATGSRSYGADVFGVRGQIDF